MSQKEPSQETPEGEEKQDENKIPIKKLLAEVLEKNREVYLQVTLLWQVPVAAKGKMTVIASHDELPIESPDLPEIFRKIADSLEKNEIQVFDPGVR